MFFTGLNQGVYITLLEYISPPKGENDSIRVRKENHLFKAI